MKMIGYDNMAIWKRINDLKRIKIENERAIVVFCEFKLNISDGDKLMIVMVQRNRFLFSLFSFLSLKILTIWLLFYGIVSFLFYDFQTPKIQQIKSKLRYY